jgi:hypothetical protein
MTKERTTITIDSELLEKSKKYIPNLSGFIEECLKNYLGVGNQLVNTSDMHELVTNISKCQLELYLMNEKGKLKEAQEIVAKQEINIAWRSIYTEYRDTKTISQHKLDNAVELLGVPAQELKDIVEVCYVFNRRDNVDVTEWSEVFNQYGGESYE